jgi:DNA-binding HxlR family transcriptional regulator
VRGSKSGRPVMALLDLLGRKWTLRILWELRTSRKTFRALREACDAASPTVLNVRLRELRETELVDLEEGEGYGLTRLGHELLEQLLPVAEWAERWSSVIARR